ncbi:Uncharacterized protein OS=Rhizobium leguminosarum bv. trifolii WSM2012 GN=Rleg10DRAFT_0054 PE=4 SV=1 [Gemmata massiliana]|uniref:Uncharacterized protein n=1 Tax=Gemmata massiliana TaxID=1210884 RepID=A0A6P2DAD3_9BACT|nr:hypothetical protein [Gemmata massiliana]VTR97893.1 Uncharacterized protein OS=Rhizobium leguminosarum bv. trifolii WSM2012 GN=Rleg10DRAFT_0054 PE=4 SV=1 [Gemmata massiliana]
MRTVLLVILAVGLAGLGPTLGRQPAAGPPEHAPEPSAAKITAVNDPDKFAWDLFLEINRPVGAEPRAVRWDEWGDQAVMYTDPNAPPVWPGAKKARNLRPSRQHELRRLQSAPLFAAPGPAPSVPDRGPDSEEVRMNRAGFDYVVQNGLWYQQGVIKQARAPGGIKFPTGAISIKALWKVITEADKPRYHWDEYQPPPVPNQPNQPPKQIIGLIALHVTSKVLPNWHWATFEQEDNPAFADLIGAHDSYGMIPADVKPNPQPDKGYKTALKPELLARMKAAGLDPAWGHYRLKGAQIDFTDATGRPTILGNSITEDGFVATSSCVTCHARATAMFQSGGGGRPAFTHLPVFNPAGQSDNGTPKPEWFWGPGTPAPPIFYQVDFLWELSFAPKYRTVPEDTK